MNIRKKKDTHDFTAAERIARRTQTISDYEKATSELKLNSINEKTNQPKEAQSQDGGS